MRHIGHMRRRVHQSDSYDIFDYLTFEAAKVFENMELGKSCKVDCSSAYRTI